MTQWLSAILRTLLLVVVAVWAVVPVGARPAAGDEPPGTVTPLAAPFQGMTADVLFAKLVERNRLRESRLLGYQAVNTYQVANQQGRVYAEEVVRVNYRAPHQKTLVTDSVAGSRLICDLVLKRLIESEAETSSGRAHHDSSIQPANYRFNLLGEQRVGPYRCFVVEAIPRRRDKYLFEGRIWIDTQDFAIVRIAGQPAKSLSFWIKRADFVRRYQKMGEFWLPIGDETLVDVRFYGKRVLSIDRGDYAINGGQAADSEAPEPLGEPSRPTVSSPH